jgi:hypothetical protein
VAGAVRRVRDRTPGRRREHPARSARPGLAAPPGSKNLTALGELVSHLQKAAPWLDLAGYETDCRSSDHALDSVVTALTARAAAQGLVTVPGIEQLDAARSEGWIALPTSPIDDLRE